MRVLAQIISRIFEPLVIFFSLFIIGGFRAGLTTNERALFVGYVTVIFAIITLAHTWMVARWKLDWDIKDRRKRIRPLLIILGIVLMNVFVVGRWHNKELFNLFYLFAIWLFGFFLITLRYKISGHVSVITLFSVLMVRWFGPLWWPVIVTVPLVAWARVVGKHHTVGQVIMGVLYSGFTLFIFSNVAI